MHIEQLEIPVSKSEIANFKLTHKNTEGGLPDEIAIAYIMASVLGLVALFMLFTMPGTLHSVVVAGFAVVCGALAFIINWRQSNARAKRGVRVERFAKSNDWTYVPQSKNLTHVASLFTVGDNYGLHDVVTSSTFEAGCVTFTTGSGRSKQSHRFGYMCVPLEHSMPHIVLDSKSNNLNFFGASISNLPVMFGSNQIDLLEGDFNKYYTLYAPEEYGVDVRYIFTPDLMSLLVGESDNIDIEIIDDALYFYFGNSQIDTPAFWERALRLRTQLGDKIVERTGRYEDDRTNNGSVAAQGVRLKRSISVFAILGFIYIIANFLFEMWARLSGHGG